MDGPTISIVCRVILEQMDGPTISICPSSVVGDDQKCSIGEAAVLQEEVQYDILNQLFIFTIWHSSMPRNGALS